MLVTFGESLTISGRVRSVFRHPDQLSQQRRILSEADAAVSDVRAGNVQLVSGDAFAGIEDADRLFVILGQKPKTLAMTTVS